MGNKRRPQGEGMVRKREDGRWEGRIVIGHKKDGTPMYKSVFGKSQKATLKQLHLLINLYRDVDLTEECRMTLGKWMDKWLDEYMIFKIKEKTMDGYRSIAEHQIKRFIGDKQLAYLTTADIQKFYNKIRKEGRVKPHPLYGYALSDSVVRKIHMTLHEALEEAVRERYIVRNPTNGTAIPKKSYGEKQVLEDSQLDTFMDAIQREPYWHDFFYVEIMTGLSCFAAYLVALVNNIFTLIISVWLMVALWKNGHRASVLLLVPFIVYLLFQLFICFLWYSLAYGEWKN